MNPDLVTWKIWAHPTRRAWAEDLAASLDRDVEIVWDTNPVPSAEPDQRWAVCRRVMESAAEGGTPYVGWLQDDALVCQDFCSTVEGALSYATRGGIILSPYTGTGRPDQMAVGRALTYAAQQGHDWFSLRSLYWGVAVAFPAAHVPMVLRVGSTRALSRMPSDYRVGVALRDRAKLRTWYPIPSLAEHRDEASLVGHDKPGLVRRAHRFVGTDVSGLGLDLSRVPAAGLVPHH